LSEVDRYQKRVLANLFSQEVTPPNPAEVPFIADFPDATIFIDEESKDAGAWAVTYRGLASTTAGDLETLEMALPTWVLEFLLTGRSLHKEPVKISFILRPEDEDDLDELPGGCARPESRIRLRRRVLSLTNLTPPLCTLQETTASLRIVLFGLAKFRPTCAHSSDAVPWPSGC
jgi:hypothetical protein